MRFLDEFRRRPATLADHLPWAVRVAPGVVLNKDGSFPAGLRFRGPDLESSTEDELMAVRARLNNALRRLGTGWCVHVDARRRPACFEEATLVGERFRGEIREKRRDPAEMGEKQRQGTSGCLHGRSL